MVTLDFGCVYQGFHTDMTRTVFVGPPRPELESAFNAVLKGLMLAERHARPGMTGQDIDKLARSVITEAGYPSYAHATGHGVGQEVHELPYLSYTAPGANVITEGMVFTIEPGIYIAGKYGLRIEDTGVMTKKGFTSFCKSPFKVYIP